MLSSVDCLMEIRAQAERDSGGGLKLFGFIAESVFGFIPEQRSESSRNRVHVPPDSPARDTGDYSAEIRFLSGIGTGLGLTGSPEQAIEHADKALPLAKQHPDTGYPYRAVAGKIMALIRLKQTSEAKPLIADARRQADRR